MSELEPIHLNSWKRFWQGFDAALNTGIRSLAKKLAEEGVRVADEDIACIVTDPELLERFAQPHEEKAALLRNAILEKPVIVTLSSSSRSVPWELGQVPLMTTRGTFVRGGAECALLGQLTHSPGVFLNRIKTVKFKLAFAYVRSAQGVPMEFRLEGDQLEVFFRGRGTVAWSTLEHVLDPTKDAPPTFAAVKSVANAIRLQVASSEAPEAEQVDPLLDAVRGYFASVDLGELGRQQLNRRLVHFNITATQSSTLNLDNLRAIVSLLKCFFKDKDGTLKNDQQNDLGNLRVRLIGDFLDDARDEWLSALYRRILKQSSNEPLVLTDALREANGLASGRSLFADFFRQWSVDLPICQRIPPDKSNYVAAAALSRRLTFNGRGGIKIGHDRPMRDFNWSHYGRLCPFDTPLSVDVGVTLSLARGARVSELGLIETPCARVESGKISEDIVWLSPWDEADGRCGWIAFPDERELLVAGDLVYVHRGDRTLNRVPAAEATHIHVSEEAMISIAACLIPYRAHNDAVRMNMACNFLRQALPLSNMMPPAVKTDAEYLLPRALPFRVGLHDQDTLAFGTDIFVGYLPWKGWNFEDAIVISESAAEALTSLHFERLRPVRLGRSIAMQEMAYLIACKKNELPDDIVSDHYDTRGIVKEGSAFAAGALFLLEPPIVWKKIPQGERFLPHKGGDLKLGPAVVHRVETDDDEDGRGWVRVVLRRSRRAQVGDKLANRHGHKGVISRIMPDHEMPYVVLDGESNSTCTCGETRKHRHLQVLINPLSVISRMNIGQLFETRQARTGELCGLPDKLACYDPAAQDIVQRELDSEVLVGVQYIMKLDHNAEDKVHARATEADAYSAFVQQPLGGRRLKGGQRLGEMEVWSLQAHGVPHLLQEMLTLKSDNPWSRRVLLEDIVAGSSKAEPELPEAFRVFTAICYGLGLDITLVGRDEHRLDPAVDRLPPDDAAVLQIGLLDGKIFKQTISKGVVTTPMISGRNEAPSVRYHRDGLESEVIFGPLKDFTCACGTSKLKPSERSCRKCGTPLLHKRARRRRMALIELDKPVPNPFILFSAPVCFGDVLSDQNLMIAFDQAAVDSQTRAVVSGLVGDILKVRFCTKYKGVHLAANDIWAAAVSFVDLCARASASFRAIMQEALGKPFWIPTPIEGRSEFGLQLAGVVAESTPKPSDDLPFEQAIRSILPSLQEGMDGKNMARRCAKAVNELLSKVTECPVDFVLDLLALVPMRSGLILEVLPVIPPDLRRVVKIPGTHVYVRNDLTVSYQRVLFANADLRNSDSSDTREYHRLRREHMCAISRLMCNQRLPIKARAWNPDTRRLRESLSSVLTGKEGLLIGNLFGKRVDFSARAVIVPDPNLDIDNCRLPFALAVKLYRPLLLRHLNVAGENDAEGVVTRSSHGEPDAVEKVSLALEALFADYPVLLNRQPTLHRLGMLAFKPLLGSGSVIALPAMVTTGFNADFDGDQMAVYLPLTSEARKEAKRLLPSLHLWRPRDGRFALNLSQDIALGMWLDGHGSRSDVAREIEARPLDSNLLTETKSSTKTAFDRVTQAGTSFSIDDLDALGRYALTGDEDDMARIMKRSDIGGNPVYRIVHSGARGNSQTLSFLAGAQTFHELLMRTRSNLTAGFKLGELLKLAQTGRRNAVNTKLLTAVGGWLTKQLVAWTQHVCITSEDCYSTDGLTVTADLQKNGLKRWIYGRVLAKDCAQLNLRTGDVIGLDTCKKIEVWLAESAGHSIVVRSPEHCKDKHGVCRACYGVAPWHGCGWSSFSKENLVPMGVPVGLIAAQAAGEPGTQMALHSKHLAGQAQEAEGDDVINGFRDLIKKGHAFWKKDHESLLNSVAELDAHLMYQEIELSVVHLDVLLRGQQQEMSDQVSWVASLAEPGGNLEQNLASAALAAKSDHLNNLRSQTVTGGNAMESGEKAR